MGFKLKPYGPCMEKNMANMRKLNTVLHVESLKLSHVDVNEVTKFIKELEILYDYTRVLRWEKHEYLGMGLDFIKKGEVKMSMVD